MKRATVVTLCAIALIVACDATYTIVMPYCPVSDSAKKAADSVPVFCLHPDTLGLAP